MKRSFGFGDTIHDLPLIQYAQYAYLVTECSTIKQEQKAGEIFAELRAEIDDLRWIRIPEDNEKKQ